MIKITPDEIKLFAQYIYKVSGVILDDSKAYLLESRLAGLLSECGCTSFIALYRHAVSDRQKRLETRIIDAITTNETLFFRDQTPYEVLRHKILPDLIDRRRGKFPNQRIPLRIWSAACSTGQEVYSIGMILKETLKDLSGFDIKLLGTDISDAAITRASYGLYNQFEIERGLGKDKVEKYFSPNGGGWRIKDEIRAMAAFERRNLMQPLNGIGPFDIVFCRNVTIYFGQKDRKELLDRIAGVLEKDGYLILGSTESLMGGNLRFESRKYLNGTFYQLAA